MNKEIIILANSEKYNNYCVAGIDTSSGKWIRIISEDDKIENAVTAQDMSYENGGIPQLLDIVRIQCKGHKPNYYQPENYVFNKSYYWEKVGKAKIDDVLKIHPLDDKEYIFYNEEKRIHKNELIRVCNLQKDNNSLILISPINIVVHVDEYPYRTTVRMTFTYNGIRYKGLSVTDLDFKEKYINHGPGNYNIVGNVYLVLSLGVCYPSDGCHYKLVTSVLK